MRPDDFGGYRGRTTASDVLRVIAVVLAVLVVLVLVLFILVQRYLVYSDEGLRLELPPFLSFLQPEDPGLSGPEPGSVTLVERPPEAEDPVPEVPLAALQLSLDAIRDGTAARQLEEAGANALILELRPPQGNLNWFSGEELAETANINSTDRGINQLLRDWNAGDIYTVARVSCLRDNTLPYYRRDLAIRAGYGNWQDYNATRWLNPARPEVCTYLAALCGELAELGFDEILLESCAFPSRTQGNLEVIVGQEGVNQQQLIQGSGGLLEQIRAAVEPSGARLSVLLDAPLPAEGSGGLTQEGLSRLADRVWLPWTGVDSEGGTENTVYLVEQLETGRQENQAVLLPDSPLISPGQK